MPSPRQMPQALTTIARRRRRSPASRSRSRRPAGRTPRRDSASAASADQRREGRLVAAPSMLARRPDRIDSRLRRSIAARRSRSSRVASATPVAPDRTDDRRAACRRDLVELPRQLGGDLARAAGGSGRSSTVAEPGVGLPPARLGVLARFEDEEGADRAEHRRRRPCRAAPRPEIGAPAQAQPPPAQYEDHVLALGDAGAADEEDVALAGADAPPGDLDGADAGDLLAHEGARRAGDLVDDRDVAGDEVGELRQEERRAEVVGQALVEERRLRRRRVREALEDGRVGRHVALAAVGGDDHVGVAEDVEVAGDAGVVEREARGVGAEPLPRSPSGAGRASSGSACRGRAAPSDGWRRAAKLVEVDDRAAAARPRPSPASGRRGPRRGSRPGRCR